MPSPPGALPGLGDIKRLGRSALSRHPWGPGQMLEVKPFF